MSYDSFQTPGVKKPFPKKILFGFVGIIVFAAVAFAGYKFLNRPKPAAPSSPAETASTPTTETSIKSIEGKYLFSGTIVLDRVVVTFAGGDTAQPYRNMGAFGKYDAGVADLECPVTSKPNRYDVNVDSPKFNCRPNWLPDLKKHFQILKLAGNHTYDMGAGGFTQTVDNIQAARLQALGHYNPHADPKNNCEVIALPVRLQKSSGGEQKATLPMAFCAFNYKIIFSPEDHEMELVNRYAKVMPVFGMLQSGAEYEKLATPEKKGYAHKIIDQGAEFVIANGAHGVQETEVYKDKLIAYSLGNFIFDQIDFESQRSVSFMVSMSVPYDENVAKWITLGKQCHPESRDDTCLEEAEKQGLTKFNPKLTFEPIASMGGVKKITTRANAKVQKDTESRLNWDQTSKELGQ